MSSPTAERFGSLILAIDSFYFLSETARVVALRNAYRALRSGGRIILHLPAGQFFQREHDATVGIFEAIHHEPDKKITGGSGAYRGRS